MTGWLWLTVAVCAEVTGTLALRSAVEDRRWYGLVGVGYLLLAGSKTIAAMGLLPWYAADLGITDVEAREEEIPPELLRRVRAMLAAGAGDDVVSAHVDRDGVNAGLAHGFGDVGVGHVASDEVGREVEDLARVAVVRRHVEALTLLRPEGLLACLGGFVEVGPRRLREVADDGPRRELSAPTDGAPPPDANDELAEAIADAAMKQHNA